MKTSGPQQTPSTTPKPVTDNKSTNKAESKPQKEFKEVLDSDRSQAPPPPKSKFGKFGPKGQKLLKKGQEENPLAATGQKPSRAGREDSGELGLKKDDFSKKTKKEDLELKEFSVPTHVMMGPASIQPKAEIQKTQGPALNIKEIESIVQKVQVGMNEKGLPEMNFELVTDKLGPLNLKISSENEKISIQFVTQDTAAQAELQKGMNDLSQLLGQRGLNLAETNVMTRDQQSQQQQQDRGRGESESTFDTQSAAKNRTRKRVISDPSDDGFTI